MGKYSGIACWMHDELTVLSPTADQLGSHTCKRLRGQSHLGRHTLDSPLNAWDLARPGLQSAFECNIPALSRQSPLGAVPSMVAYERLPYLSLIFPDVINVNNAC